MTADGARAHRAFGRVLVIAHRGASGYRPEHTLSAYRLAIRQGADFIEPDLVATRDGILVARHENEISTTTDVGVRSEFAGRRTTKTIDGVELDGWFTEDFTLAELRGLRARERMPELRPRNTRWDGRWQIPTFEEVLTLAARASRALGRPIGVYPETKHPSYFADIGLALEPPLLAGLARHPEVPAFIQSFEATNLARLRRLTDRPLVRLLATGAVDVAPIAAHADVIGVHKDLVIPRDASGRLAEPTSLVDRAHAAGLAVHVWTFRAEPPFVAAGIGVAGELRTFASAGIDGIFTDHPDVAVRALSQGDEPARPGAGRTSR